MSVFNFNTRHTLKFVLAAPEATFMITKFSDSLALGEPSACEFIHFLAQLLLWSACILNRDRERAVGGSSARKSLARSLPWCARTHTFNIQSRVLPSTYCCICIITCARRAANMSWEIYGVHFCLLYSQE